jgi:hypothetical protein
VRFDHSSVTDLLEASSVSEAGNMGRPIGSVNRQRPFTDALRLALQSGGGRRLRIIADKLVGKAEEGDLQAIREIADRLDGKPAQAIERGVVPVEVLSDYELFAILRRGSPEPVDEPRSPMIAGPKPQ